MLGSKFTNAMKKLQVSDGDIKPEVEQGKSRASTIRAVQAMDEINNLLSSDDEENC